MQTRHCKPRQKLSQSATFKESLSGQFITKNMEDDKISQQSTEMHNNFLGLFQQFYEKVNNLETISLIYLQDYFSIDKVLNSHEVMDLQIKLSKQWIPRLRKNWNEDEKHVLIWIVLKYIAYKGYSFINIPNEAWLEISQLMSRRSANNCKAKWISLSKIPLQQVPWTKNQDTMLQSLINQYNSEGKHNRWSQIAFDLNQAISTNGIRTPKQCRERWNNHLNPDIHKENWNLNEDICLLELVKKYKRKWAFISKSLKIKTTIQRSENAVKNRFNCLIKKNKEFSTIPDIISELKQKNELQEPINQEIIRKKTNKEYFQFEIVRDQQILQSPQLETCFIDLSQNIIYKISAEQFRELFTLNPQVKIEIDNPIDSCMSKYFEQEVKYVKPLFPAQFQERKSFFNIPPQQFHEQPKQFIYNSKSSFYNFQKPND